MHESSLIVSLLRQVDELVETHQATRVTEVRLEIGLLSNVEPILLREAFDRLKNGTTKDAELMIDDIGLKCRCHACSTEFSAEQLKFLCPLCNSNDIAIISGDGVLLVSATLESTS